jgi:Na+-translocating ferredoxin:NAD+ oxidoreductase RnfD subunit
MQDLTEFRDLVAFIKADRQAQKDKDARDGWTKFVSLSMIFIAVLAAVATQKSGGFSSGVMKKLNEATFNQAAASDQWSLYEAKSIKQSLVENQIDLLKDVSVKDAKSIAALEAKAKRYNSEKADIMKEAQGLEAKRDEARKAAERLSFLGSQIALSSTIFQVAVALGGVCLIMKKKGIWWISLTLGTLATLQMIRVLFFM